MATHPKRANLRVIALWMANQQNLASALANSWTIIFLVSSKKTKIASAIGKLLEMLLTRDSSNHSNSHSETNSEML